MCEMCVLGYARLPRTAPMGVGTVGAEPWQQTQVLPSLRPRLPGNSSLGLSSVPPPPRPGCEASGTASFLRILVLQPRPAAAVRWSRL